MNIVKTIVINEKERKNPSHIYLVDKDGVSDQDTMIVEIRHENNHFSGRYKFRGRDVFDIDELSFSLQQEDKKMHLLWSGIQPIQAQIIMKSKDVNVKSDDEPTEKEKMLMGELYLPTDEELICERLHARNYLYDFHQARPSQMAGKEQILDQLFGTKGENTMIETGFFCDYGYNIHVGDNFFMNADCTILDSAEVRIGNNVLCAPKVGIYTVAHPLEAEARIKGLESAKPITIGHNVWLGAGAMVLPGVTIGNNVVIGAGSVVTKDIPDNVLAYGNPCRVIRKIEE